ncbi:unnamed protein product [Diatraea saccharalis]|uniref:Uncharacterized protein n=1 Tax=Diatraea saccharalis TaxID=40085 RepID=A0A9N9QWF4_9NEOP|nr:unnamed protein product [Diatraea saccharalis]
MSYLALFFLSFVCWTQTSYAVCPCMQKFIGVDLSGFAKPANTNSLAVTSTVPSALPVPVSPISITNVGTSNIPSAFTLPLSTVSNNVVTSAAPVSNVIGSPGLINPGLGLANAGMNNYGYGLANTVGSVSAGLNGVNAFGIL